MTLGLGLEAEQHPQRPGHHLGQAVTPEPELPRHCHPEIRSHPDVRRPSGHRARSSHTSSHGSHRARNKSAGITCPVVAGPRQGCTHTGTHPSRPRTEAQTGPGGARGQGHEEAGPMVHGHQAPRMDRPLLECPSQPSWSGHRVSDEGRISDTAHPFRVSQPQRGDNLTHVQQIIKGQRPWTGG